MTVHEAWNRGNNLVATSIVALAGFAFLPEAFLEDEIAYKLDDIAMFLLGLVAIWWYKKGNNRFQHSVAPVVLTGIALLVKIAAIFIEFKDKEDVGDDMGALVLFVIAFIFVLYLYKRKAPSA